MFRILHTACAALLVAAALIAYGVKEETAALQREKQDLQRRKARLAAEIATLEAEWAYLNGPETLLRTAAKVYGPGRLIGAEGEVLTELRPEQAVSLKDLPFKPTTPAPSPASGAEAAR
ncbi:MAG: hypothetical protein KTR21_10955 [Rhodobacteraceae bacterium]|nr:hypothetical protein [Paracoccaceae bacterium]